MTLVFIIGQPPALDISLLASEHVKKESKTASALDLVDAKLSICCCFFSDSWLLPATIDLLREAD